MPLTRTRPLSRATAKVQPDSREGSFRVTSLEARGDALVAYVQVTDELLLDDKHPARGSQQLCHEQAVGIIRASTEGQGLYDFKTKALTIADVDAHSDEPGYCTYHMQLGTDHSVSFLADWSSQAGVKQRESLGLGPRGRASGPGSAMGSVV